MFARSTPRAKNLGDVSLHSDAEAVLELSAMCVTAGRRVQIGTLSATYAAEARSQTAASVIGRHAQEGGLMPFNEGHLLPGHHSQYNAPEGNERNVNTPSQAFSPLRFRTEGDVAVNSEQK
jgi:hypothetical protein